MKILHLLFPDPEKGDGGFKCFSYSDIKKIYRFLYRVDK